MNDYILSCDWGTSSFRLRLVRTADSVVLSSLEDEQGIARVYREWVSCGLDDSYRQQFYLDILSRKIESLPVIPDAGTPVFISGMVSSSIGLVELPYASLPFHLDGTNMVVKQFTLLNGRECYVFSGISDKQDVMRGEETMLLGCDTGELAETIMILPGTHSKHAVVSGSEIVAVQTFMTGELFDLLATNSILSASVMKPGSPDYSSPGFQKGLEDGFTGLLLNAVFRTRIRSLLDGCSERENYYYLSGVLIGSELQALKNGNRPVHLVAGQKLMPAYRRALAVVLPSLPVIQAGAEAAIVEGHLKLARLLT